MKKVFGGKKDNISLQQPLSMEPLPFPCHPERTRISCCTALTGDPGCGSLQREPHAADRSRNSRQEIRGRRGICGAPFGSPKFIVLQPLSFVTLSEAPRRSIAYQKVSWRVAEGTP